MAKRLEGPAHDPAVAKPQGGIHLHYSTKNWSDSYLCPTCGVARRYNKNFLGNKMVVCTGTQLITVPSHPLDSEVDALKAQGINLAPLLKRIEDRLRTSALALGVI